MFGVYWQLIKVLWYIHRDRARGYANVHLSKYFKCCELYPKTKELLKKRGYILHGYNVLANSKEPAHWEYSDFSISVSPYCSVCHCIADEEYDYCPRCGSLMHKGD